jgi:hypothetical protein
MTLHLIDRILAVLAFITPVYCVLRWNLPGVFIGAFLCWGILIVARSILARLDPERGGSVLDGVWLLFGWFASLVYCVTIYGLKRLYIFVRNKRVPSRDV